MEYSTYYKKKRNQSAPLNEDIHADILVVGSGITGLSCAYHLTLRGKNVVLVDSGSLPSGASERAMGMVAKAMEEDVSDVLAKKNGDKMHDYIDRSVTELQKFILDNNISCGYRELPAYYVATKKSHVKQVKSEYYSRVSLNDDVNFFESLDRIKDKIPTGFAATKEKIYILNSVSLCEQIANKLAGKCTIYENTRIDRIDQPEKVAYFGNKKIRYDKAVLTCFVPGVGASNIEKNLIRVRTFAIVSDRIPGVNSQYCFWTSEEPGYHTGIVLDDGKVMFGGNDFLADGSTSSLSDNIEVLRGQIREFFPLIDETVILNGWDGIIEMSIDGIPFVGKWDDDIFVSRGVVGIPMGFENGKILSGMICGDNINDSEVFDPHRKMTIIQRIQRPLIHNKTFNRVVNLLLFRS